MIKRRRRRQPTNNVPLSGIGCNKWFNRIPELFAWNGNGSAMIIKRNGNDLPMRPGTNYAARPSVRTGNLNTLREGRGSGTGNSPPYEVSEAGWLDGSDRIVIVGCVFIKRTGAVSNPSNIISFSTTGGGYSVTINEAVAGTATLNVQCRVGGYGNVNSATWNFTSDGFVRFAFSWAGNENWRGAFDGAIRTPDASTTQVVTTLTTTSGVSISNLPGAYSIAPNTAYIIAAKSYASDEMLKLMSSPNDTCFFDCISPVEMFVLSGSTAGGTVYNVTVTDGVYFFDGDQPKEHEHTLLDSLLASEFRFSEVSKLVSDDTLLSETVFKDWQATKLDSLFLYSSATVDQLGSAIDLVITDYLFINDFKTFDTLKNISDSVLLASQLVKLHELFNIESLFLSSQVFRAIDLTRYDALYISDIQSRLIELNRTDMLLADDTDRLFILREMLLRDGLLTNDDVIKQLYTVVTAVLVYAKIQTKDLLGISVRTKSNLLGISHGRVGTA